MIAQIDIVNIGVVSSCYVAVIGVMVWVSRTKVNHKTFDVERENNKTDHENIRKWIEDTEERAKERHTELKTDLKELKGLIQNNGNSKP